VGFYFFKWNIIKARDPHKNVLSTHMKEIEPYDLMFENHMQPKKKCSKNNLIMHVYQQVDECVHMKILHHN
jgi:hypothetical protein